MKKKWLTDEEKIAKRKEREKKGAESDVSRKRPTRPRCISL